MLNLFFYFLLCLLLAGNSLQNKIRSMLKDYYRLAQPLGLEKLVLYLLLEGSKVIIIIKLGCLLTDFFLGPILGLFIYLATYILSGNCSNFYFLFGHWVLLSAIHPQALQLSLAQFLSCYLLFRNKSLTILLTIALIPINLIISSANIFLTAFSIMTLLLLGLKDFSNEILNKIFKNSHLFFRLQ